MKKFISLILTISLIGSFCKAEVSLSNMFGDNMILQRDKSVKIWGCASPGEKVEVSFYNQNIQTKANEKGEWQVYLKPMSVNRNPQMLKVTGDNNQVICSNILLGDVWLLGGQSNMEFELCRGVFDGELEILASNNSNIRLYTVPYDNSSEKGITTIKRGAEYNGWYGEYEDKGCWFPCYPEKAKQFSAIGYMFGKTLQQITGIPIGLIDASRGGTTVESWLSPEKLASMPENAELLKMWNQQARDYNPKKVLKKEIENWKKNSEDRKKHGLEPYPKPTEPTPSPAVSQLFPGASYNGMIYPMKGFTLKGIIFNHGFNNALGDARPKLYALDFDALIKDWRETFEDKELPFGIIELTAGGEPQLMDKFEVALLDAGPFIREGQYKAYLNNPNTGYCCAYDQQVNFYHPQKKLPLGVRMARWALATQYGYKDIAWEPAKILKTEKTANTIIVTFDKEVKASDDRPIEGFAIAGSDGHFYPAKAEYVEKGKDNWGSPQYDKTRLVISNPFVTAPADIRYAWARNPIANLVSDQVIPVPLFRTDHWDHMEAPYLEWMDQGFIDYRSKMYEQKKIASDNAHKRKIQEAEYILKNK